MSLLNKIWRISGSLKIRDYAKIMSLINTIAVLIFIVFAVKEEIHVLSPVLNYFHETSAKNFLFSRISYLILFIILGVVFLLLNIRFYPFVQPWITNALFQKPRISQSINRARSVYQRGYNKKTNEQTQVKVTSKVDKDLLGNVKWETDFVGNIKNDLSGVPIPKVKTQITQTAVENSRSFNGAKEAYESLAANGFSYIFKFFVSLFIWLLSWYFSFVLGWIAISKYIEQ